LPVEVITEPDVLFEAALLSDRRVIQSRPGSAM
jgi:hypothetical protein